jgi:hypothetical protein
MKTFACIATALLASSAFAAERPGGQPAAAAVTLDLTKVGPGSRKPKDENAVVKEVAAFLKQQEEISKRHDMNAMLSGIDFPVFMATDDSKGKVESKLFTRDEYVEMMKPFESMSMEVTPTHKWTISVLSDSMANVVDDYTVTQNKKKISGRSTGLLIMKDGNWMWKTMSEAGWGDVMAPVAKQPPARAPGQLTPPPTPPSQPSRNP